MAQLNSELMINGINLYQAYGYKSVLVTASDTRVFGAERSVTVNNRTNGIPTSYSLSKSRPKITVELVKMSRGKKTPEKITHKDLRDLSVALFKNGISILQERNIAYYGWFVKGNSWFNAADQGYLTLEFELASPYCYSPTQTESFWIDGQKRFALRNVATADEMVYPRIKIIGSEDGNVKIRNVTNNNQVIVKNVKKDEEIVIEGETREIYSITKPSENMFSRLEYTKDFLFLNYGENEIIVEGNCQIEFMFQCPMLIV